MKTKFSMIFLVFSFLSSCSNKKGNNLELQVENKFIYLKDTLKPRQLGVKTITDYKKNNGVIFSYKLINNSKNKYLLYLNSYEFGFFSKPTKFNTFVNLNILNKKDSILDIKPYHLPFRRNLEECECQIDSDSLVIEHYNDLGYTDRNFILGNEMDLPHLYYLHPGEIIHFKTFVTLPFQISDDGYLQGYNTFDGVDEYFIRLHFTNHKEMTKRYLTDEQLKNIEVNEYEIFEGTVFSNKVPIKLK